jgi:uncharacterized protein YbbK (DUF523 family)
VNKILISACLLGDRVRYDGQSKLLTSDTLETLISQQRVIKFCPEIAGGLPVPRPAAEIVGGDGNDVLINRANVLTGDGQDVSNHFIEGAQQALALCRKHNISVVILTETSPSCGSQQIYDGSFSRKVRAGDGVTSALLKQHDIQVFDQHQLEQAFMQLEDDNNKAIPQ